MIEKNVETFVENDIQYEKTTYYEVLESGDKVIRGTAKVAITKNEEQEPVPDPVMEKLNDMEEKLNTLTSDSVTVANVETAILEGVNEV